MMTVKFLNADGEVTIYNLDGDRKQINVKPNDPALFVPVSVGSFSRI